MIKRRNILLTSLGLLGIAIFLLLDPNTRAAQAQGAILYVAPGGDCGGASPCYATIQGAVDAASNGDTIKVAQGTYTSIGSMVVYINKALAVRGGYATSDWSTSNPDARPTVIDAENVPGRRGVYVDGTGVSAITLSELTIQRGNAQNSNGGGIYVITGTVVVQNSKVLDSTATGYPTGQGGGVYVGGGSVTLSGNTFQGNSVSYHGGAVAIVDGNLSISNNTFQSNGATNGPGDFYGGGGLYIGDGSATVSGNSFVSNWTGSYGGAIYIAKGKAILSNNSIQTNSAGFGGGGVFVDHRGAVVTMNTNTCNV
jgi:hypothetical protein